MGDISSKHRFNDIFLGPMAKFHRPFIRQPLFNHFLARHWYFLPILSLFPPCGVESPRKTSHQAHDIRHQLLLGVLHLHHLHLLDLHIINLEQPLQKEKAIARDTILETDIAFADQPFLHGID